ncbi:hypothetical protein [Sphingobacterium multivorum]|uniref:hypothetical protein n=1 Tax=Sphingobacterium multivorum TaxID=28454 RepID=UPI003DA1D704
MVISLSKKPGQLPRATLTAIIPQAGLNDYLMRSLKQHFARIFIKKAHRSAFFKTSLPKAEDNVLRYRMYSLSLV